MIITIVFENGELLDTACCLYQHEFVTYNNIKYTKWKYSIDVINTTSIYKYILLGDTLLHASGAKPCLPL